ncbi:MAG: hypothetical protein JWO12_2630 [Frankiales bacterium]|nr:hypothetical protein [Frankiales bacterium]
MSARRLLAIAGALALLPLTAQADPTPSPTGAAPEAPLAVIITTLLPRAPKEHGPVQVKGVIKNFGTTKVTDITVRLKVGEVVDLRDQLHASDTDRPVTSARTRTTPVLTTLAPGASLPFDIRTTTDDLELRKLGAYPLDVEARGNAGEGVQPLGLAPTWLPYFPGVNPNPIRIAVVLPVVDEPHQGVDSSLRDDELAARLAPGGRLWAMVNAGRAAANPECEPGALGPKSSSAPPMTRCGDVPVTFAIDPDLLVAATAMSKPYKVKTDNGKLRDGQGTEAAKSWLSSMREATTTDQVLALPYADPDVTALARRPEGGDDVANAVALGRSTITDLLGANPIDSVAWPPVGPVSHPAADLLARNGAKALVLDESAYGQVDVEPPTTPSSRSVFTSSATGAELDGLVADSDLSDLVTGPDPDSLGPRLAEQRFLAETAVLSAQKPSAFRTYVIAPERRSAASIQALTASLRDLGRVPWLCPVTLTAVAAGTEHCEGHLDSKVRQPVERGTPRTDEAGQLSASYLAGVARDRNVIEQLTTSVFSDSQDPAVRDLVASTKLRLRQAVARAQSSAWREDPAVGRRRAEDLHLEVNRLSDKVAVHGGKALLTSSKGTLQVSLENTLNVPVDVHVQFSDAKGVIPTTQTGLVNIPPGHAVQAGVKVEPKTSGKFVVTARIIDRSGTPLGPAACQPPFCAEIIVKSTAFGRTALAVTLGAAGVLFVAAGVRIVRRALASRS